MAQSEFSKQVAQLRKFVVGSYIVFIILALLGAFFLAWNERAGFGYFIGFALILAFWTAVVATCSRVSAGEVLRIFPFNGKKPIEESDREVA